MEETQPLSTSQAKMLSKRRKISHDDGVERPASVAAFPKLSSKSKKISLDTEVESPTSSKPESETLDNASKQESEEALPETFKELVRTFSRSDLDRIILTSL